MNTKMKVLLYGILFTTVSFSLQAQEKAKKYEYATVTQMGFAALYISVTGKLFETRKLSETKSQYDHHELLNYIDDMQKEGWEVFNTQTLGVVPNNITVAFILRREQK